MITSVVVGLTLFLLTWGPYLNVGIGYFGDTQSLAAVIVVAFFGLRGWRRAPKEVRVVTLWTLFMTLGVLFLSAGYEKLYYVPILRIGRASAIFLACWCLVNELYARKGGRAGKIVLYVVYVGLVAHAVLMLVQFFLPVFREAMIKWTFAGDGVEFSYRTRMPGLTNGGGAQLSVFQSMGILMFPFCFAMAKTLVERIFTVVGLGILAVSVILAGRSGIYAVVIFGPLGIVWVGWHVRKLGGIISLSLKILVLVVSIVSAAGVVWVADMLLRRSEGGEDYNEFVFARNLDIFMNPEEGLITNSTTLELWQNHMIIPKEIKVLLIGDLSHMDHSQGANAATARLLDSDIGYVRMLFSYGIFGSAMQYALYMYILARVWQARKREVLLAGVSMIFVMVILLFQWKEVFVFTRIGWSLCATVFCAFLASKLYKEADWKWGAAQSYSVKVRKSCEPVAA